MNKKLLITIGIVILFLGCNKKKDTYSANEYSVSVAAYPVKVASTLKGVNTTYLLQGAIIAPSPVELFDHGFIIKGSPNIYRKFNGGRKIGLVEDYYTTQTPLYDSLVAFYVVFHNGDSLRSDVNYMIKYKAPIPPNPNFSGFYINPVTAGITQLTLTTNYNANSPYIFGTEILYFKDTKGTKWSSFPLPPNPSYNAFTLEGAVPGLIQGTTYDFKVTSTFYPPQGPVFLNPISITTKDTIVTFQ